jgi:mutator protein MutT
MPHICVGALVVRGLGGVEFLLGKRAATRAFYPNVWDLPGGHCEPGETVEQALVRELQEELGVTPTAWNWLADIHTTAPSSAEALVLHVYAVSAWTGTPRNCQPAEHDELGWFRADEASRLNLAHPDYPSLFRLVAGTAEVP